jgi:NAD(P)H dehydrogenase (quinone)
MDLNSAQPLVNCYGASKGHSCNFISPNDVADAALCVVLSPRDHYNRIYTLLGPELMTLHDITNLMSKYYGKNIESVDIGLSMYHNVLLERNIPRWKVKDLVAMQQVLASGLEKNIVRYMQNDFETICSYRPESFTEYLTRTDTMTYLESGITNVAVM